MTPQQIDMVRTSWAALHPFESVTADLFYARLFELAPDTRPLFKRDIHEQGLMLTRTLSAVVAGLDKLDAVLPVAGQLARRHVEYGVKPQHYDSVGTALIWTLAQSLGTAFTPAVRQAWIEAYALLAGAMKQAAYPPAATGRALQAAAS